ncbi:hypothetical protein TNCV_2128131 [Trichonephila clavipes]|nr:hypothetical protein TNCV_2128131 [Trichonephila clavipes]
MSTSSRRFFFLPVGTTKEWLPSIRFLLTKMEHAYPLPFGSLGQSLQNGWNKWEPYLDDEKEFNDDHREEITFFVQSIPEIQECDKEDVESWMACNGEDCGFQILNDDEIGTSVQEESDPVKDETDKDEGNNNESSKGPSNADPFSALETAMEWFPTTAAQKNQRPCSQKTKLHNGTAKTK